MPFHRRAKLLAIALALNITTPVQPQSTAKKQSSPAAVKGLRAASLTDRERVIHALNRLTFGPKPGDVDSVMSKGLDAWIEDQLHPESIDDSALNARLAPYGSTRMNPKQLAQSFPSDAVIRQIIAGKRPTPDDPQSGLVYSVNIARIKQEDFARAQAANVDAAAAKPNPGASPESAVKPASPSPVEVQARALADSLLALPKNQRLAALENTAPERLVNFPSLLRPDQRERLLADSSPQERETLRALSNPAAVVGSELQQAKLVRDIYSERQLLEVMTDFWFNHFNVFQYKNQCVYYLPAYERDAIRPRALGKFYDLLVATAQSPAMLMYLDNWLSVGPHSQAAGKNGQNGLNENYGRELMELHTLGVNGGYTQTDVTELARVLTGWTIAQPDDGGQFQFDPRRHEPGAKTVLGEKFFEAGVDEGLQALNMLAHRPSTARFISRSIATKFVSDDPPEALVDRMAEKFLSSDGDIREVLRTMLHSPEFWSPNVYRTKMKTPLELVVSAIRASGTNVVTPDALLQNLTAMAMPPYGMAVPTGYSMKSEVWDNEGALLARINFSTALTQGNLPGVQFDPGGVVTLGILTSLDQPRTKAVLAEKPTGLDFAIALTEDTILPSELLPKEESIVRKETEDPEAIRSTTGLVNRLRLIVAFLLASPEFQHR